MNIESVPFSHVISFSVKISDPPLRASTCPSGQYHTPDSRANAALKNTGSHCGRMRCFKSCTDPKLEWHRKIGSRVHISQTDQRNNATIYPFHAGNDASEQRRPATLKGTSRTAQVMHEAVSRTPLTMNSCPLEYLMTMLTSGYFDDLSS
ncbi:hypothetical protein BaRGS_00009408 [Batillaria attramentaria]|uniref:Uncharacterized protein n=1 Tax=Batillaria attramentaria TaxID=370345 RepID=A0ABD0LJ34_9CAEN